ncbi:MAG: TonB family protein [Paludibacteraceae bacterium]|nr:TonB family protein [Paludibacteraceae bacterium]
MKKCFFLISLFIAFVVNMDLKAETSSDDIYVFVEQMPEFPGGQKALFAFLAENTKYPIEAIQQSIEGKVICQFIVEKDGSIDSIQVIRSVYPSLDTEAVRVLGLMPQWEPGRKR